MTHKINSAFFTFYGLLSILLMIHITSCAQKMVVAEPIVTEAICVIKSTEGSLVKGVVIFRQTPEGVKIVTDLSGLTPGLHGFHVHEFGDCSAPDGSSAGGHFNPNDQPHGALMDEHRHAGDMGNIIADAAGNSHTDFLDKTMKLNGENSIINKGLIIHKNSDDLKTQPTGNAGPREGCGTIVIARQN